LCKKADGLVLPLVVESAENRIAMRRESGYDAFVLQIAINPVAATDRRAHAQSETSSVLWNCIHLYVPFGFGDL
jgi:hypothetical protein